MIAVLTVERATNCGSFRPLTPLDFHKRFKTWIEAFVERFERLIVQVAAGCTFFLIILEPVTSFPRTGIKNDSNEESKRREKFSFIELRERNFDIDWIDFGSRIVDFWILWERLIWLNRCNYNSFFLTRCLLIKVLNCSWFCRVVRSLMLFEIN